MNVKFDLTVLFLARRSQGIFIKVIFTFCSQGHSVQQKANAINAE